MGAVSRRARRAASGRLPGRAVDTLRPHKREVIFSPVVAMFSPNRLTGAHPKNRLTSTNAPLLNAIPQRRNR